MAEWDPEIEVDEDRARSLIEAQFPELRGTTIDRVAEGWDNTVHLVDGHWAFRFPRRAVALPGLEREIRTLPRLAPHLPLPIPAPRFVGRPTDDHPWPWFGATWIDGVELPAARLPDPDRQPLGTALGGFLRELHSPRVNRLVGADLPVDPLRRGDMGFRVPQARRRLDEAVDAGLWDRADEVEALLRRAASLPVPPRVLVLHGDLHMRHVLVSPDGAATGVIDWGDAATGDPSLDLSVAFGSLVGDARRAFVEAYGPIDGLTEMRARVIATFLAAALLTYAVDRGMEELRDEARASLHRVVA